MRKRKAYAREEKLQIIIGVFLSAYQRGGNRLTVADVAHAIDNTPSQRLRDLMHALVAQDVLDVEVEEIPGCTGIRRNYGLSANYLAYAAAPESRQKTGHELRINSRKGSIIEVLR
jgi:hypothetical protein